MAIPEVHSRAVFESTCCSVLPPFSPSHRKVTLLRPKVLPEEISTNRRYISAQRARIPGPSLLETFPGLSR